MQEDPTSLFGRIDWVTKKVLIDEAGKDLDVADKKRIDIQYHELGTGFYALLQKEDLTLRIISPEEIQKAKRTPSSPDKVQIRTLLIKKLTEKGLSLSMNWDNIYVGSWAEREVIDLNQYRKNKQQK